MSKTTARSPFVPDPVPLMSVPTALTRETAVRGRADPAAIPSAPARWMPPGWWGAAEKHESSNGPIIVTGANACSGDRLAI